MKTAELKKTQILAKPFLRWAGGKGWLVKQLEEFLPKDYNRYFEPFLGGGSVFFSLNPQKKIYLSDLNNDLINAYVQIRDNPEDVIGCLKKFKNNEKAYYKTRAQKYESDIQRAAQFIYLNKTSFNGIYRVNSSGSYNVPYGFVKTYNIGEEELRQSALKLKKAIIVADDFERALKKTRRGDLAFLDPPYTVAHEKNGFIAYNQKIFSLEDQERLAEVAKGLDSKGVSFILSNASHKAIKSIYKGVGSFHKRSRASLIGGIGAQRGLINELIITNIK